MHKTSLNNKGFGAIGVLAIIIVLVAIGGIGAYVWHRDHKKTTTTSGNTTTATSHSSSVTTTTPDPYAGWKTYTDTQHHYAFRYPGSWKLDANADQVSVLNSANDVEVDYIYPYVHDSGLLTFKPTSINTFHSTGLSLTIVGGVYSPSNEPDYGIVDSSLLTTYPLVAGKTTQFPGALRFTDTFDSGSPSVAFRARSSVTLTPQEASAWFGTADAKTSLLILESLSHN